jgi:DNA mismatch repair protein MutS
MARPALPEPGAGQAERAPGDAARVERATPLQAQYQRLRAQHPDALLLFRLGDFYELFGEDAERAAPLLEVVLTRRDGVPMCGVPHHALDVYLARLLARGVKVAVAEQVEDPATARGLVRREVVRVVTPGTVVEPGLLDDRVNVRCVAVDGRSLASVDASTGEFRVAETSDVWGEVARLGPAEILVAAGTPLPEGIEAPVTEIGPEAFDPDLARAQFGAEAEGTLGEAAPAAGALLGYLRRTQGGTAQITRCERYFPDGHLRLDATARRNLELTRRLADGGAGEGTLLGVLDSTLTPMGARLLREWIERPLLDPRAIQQRLDAVDELHGRPLFRAGLRRALRGVHDLERLVGRAATGRAGARDLAALGASLRRLPEVQACLAGVASPLLSGALSAAEPLPEVEGRLSAALDEEARFRPGYDEALDGLRQAAREGRDWLGRLEARERERTGVRSLKVGYNRVFGYFIEVSHANRDRVPPEYVRRQTLAGAERYLTPELKELEERILGAEERAARREEALLEELRLAVAARTPRLQAAARALGELDVLASLAEVAAREGYVRPHVDGGLALAVRGGRHPVLERALGRARFVPNDTEMDGEGRSFLLITGPNMAGKSTYMRQVALIALLAQVGSFVPAREARVGVVDRIFTRIGASDDLAGGRSTFMVEMTEVASLLRSATRRSLLLLDEVGRGTSTLDGLAIAWAVAEDVTRRVRCRTLFATHFHELTAVVEGLPGAANVHVAVREQGSSVVFLHRIVPGWSDRSYGIHVARLAGLPDAVLARAEELLRGLQARGGLQTALPGTSQAAAAAPPPEARADRRAADLAERVRLIDPLRLTPLEALQVLHDLRQGLEA